MEHSVLSRWRRATKRAVAPVALTLSALVASAFPLSAAAQGVGSFNPTLLVNTEAFITVDEGSGSSDMQIRFGDTADAVITYDVSEGTFDIQKGLEVWGTLTVSGSLLVTENIIASGSLKVNADETGDGTISFGVSGGDETFSWNNTTALFELSDDLSVTGGIEATQTITGSKLDITSGTVRINGVAYEFTNTQASGTQYLKNDGSGNLTWSSVDTSNAVTAYYTKSGTVTTLNAEYAGAVYTQTGSAYVGQLALKHDASNARNYYQWTSTQGTDQTYEIVAQYRLPDDFGGFDSTALRLLHKSDANSAISYVRANCDGSNVSMTLNGDSSWQADTITDMSAASCSRGDLLTVRIAVTSANNGVAQVGELTIDWKYPGQS